MCGVLWSGLNMQTLHRIKPWTILMWGNSAAHPTTTSVPDADHIWLYLHCFTITLFWDFPMTLQRPAVLCPCGKLGECMWTQAVLMTVSPLSREKYTQTWHVCHDSLKPPFYLIWPTLLDLKIFKSKNLYELLWVKCDTKQPQCTKICITRTTV